MVLYAVRRITHRPTDLWQLADGSTAHLTSATMFNMLSDDNCSLSLQNVALADSETPGKQKARSLISNDAAQTLVVASGARHPRVARSSQFVIKDRDANGHVSEDCKKKSSNSQ